MLDRVMVFLVDLVITIILGLVALGAVTATNYMLGRSGVKIPDIPDAVVNEDWLDEVKPEMGNNE